MTIRSANKLARPVTLVIPVYRDLKATRECIESVIASELPENTLITIIDDCSPEKELSDYCRDIAGKAGFRLIVNDVNLGFVKTANRGFALDSDTDILLLNSDTVVSHDWLQRLQSCAYKDTEIGTVTPFSNNGTICSYPVFPLANDLPAQWTAAELDKAFQSANTGTYGEIPTAVGFCLYIKRSCLNQTGPFDEENFGQGYGEECDFSLRASKLGWKHAIAADVFVYHAGGASFASESTGRKRHADKVMDELHPNYHALVTIFIQSDPLYDFRRNVDVIRLRKSPSESTAIFEEHYQYTRTLLERAAENRKAMLSEQEQRQSLEKIVGDNRRQFEETDRALADAQKVAYHLRSELDNLAAEHDKLTEQFHKVTEQLHMVQDFSSQLSAHIRNMEQSRSWRYTAWLRRK